MKGKVIVVVYTVKKALKYEWLQPFLFLLFGRQLSNLAPLFKLTGGGVALNIRILPLAAYTSNMHLI